MKNSLRFLCVIALLAVAVAMVVPVRRARADGFPAAPEPPQAQSAASDLAPGSAHLINPEELVKVLQSPKGDQPLILNVGPYLLYAQAHIPGSEYVGAGSDPMGIASLHKRVKTLPHNKFIVLYCGCCPWSHCPNVRPAYAELHRQGFTNVKVLYITGNIGTDWVDKGYPTVKGQ